MLQFPRAGRLACLALRSLHWTGSAGKSLKLFGALRLANCSWNNRSSRHVPHVGLANQTGTFPLRCWHRFLGEECEAGVKMPCSICIFLACAWYRQRVKRLDIRRSFRRSQLVAVSYSTYSYIHLLLIDLRPPLPPAHHPPMPLLAWEDRAGAVGDKYD